MPVLTSGGQSHAAKATYPLHFPFVWISELRPISMDPVYPPSRWQVPCPPAGNDVTYSNLAFAPPLPKLSGHESVGSAAELNGPASGAAEYACVRRGNKGGGVGAQPHRDQRPRVPSPSPGPDTLKLEEMYSKVKKKKRPMEVSSRAGATESAPACSVPPTAGIPPKRVPSAQSDENLYESICEMGSCAPEADGNGTVITEL
eukprot:XP_002944690.2 PREDICTED: uncharacterized protein LOC100489775 [Xenopus tropicalis]